MNPIHLLACNPFAGVPWDSLFFIFFVVKPITYFAFTYAFRYRVGHRIPLTTGRILGIAIVRTILGVAVVGIEGTYLGLEGNLFASYSYMYISRFFVWYFIGILMLSLRKERLALWVGAGLALNFLFDLTVANFWFEDWRGIVMTAGITALLAYMLITGRREELRYRFDANRCKTCGYNLTGNVSGVCSECGTPIIAANA